MTPTIRASFDHLIVAADTLDQGDDYIESLFGVRPRRGGQHIGMGTHNSVLKLGDRAYLEVIAIDPSGITPQRPRWFDLDRPSMRALLQQQPRLVNWAARVDHIEAARSANPVDWSSAHAMARGPYKWQITIPDDGHLPAGGAVPTLVQWNAGSPHPADALPDAGLSLATIAAAHPEPERVRTAVAALGLTETLKVTYDPAPRLAAMVHTPRGTVTL